MDETVRPARTAADWGADEVFASVPRRRFRGDQHSTLSGQRRGQHGQAAALAAAGDDPETAARAAWLAEVEAEIAHAELPADVGLVAAAPVEELPEDLTDGVSFDDEPAAWTGAPEDGGRRTVTITGRPGDTAPAPRRPQVSERRRPPRTVEERLATRPDRIAGWSFGMGLLLIAVAAIS